MSRWVDSVLPRLVDRGLSGPDSDVWRAKATLGTSGEMLELGFGAGNNLAHYPAQVTGVLAVEPSDLAWRRAQPRIAAFARPVTRVALDGASLPLPDASVSTVVSTWTLCTIPDLESALREVHRVLRPGGRMRLVEHGLAPDARLANLQRRIQPWWGPVGGGCHVDRDIPAYLRAAGFATDGLSARYAIPGRISRPWSWFVSGEVTPVSEEAAAAEGPGAGTP